MEMSIPVWVLLAFAVWTMLVLILTVGTYRWGLVFAGRAKVNEFRADQIEGSDWYRRAMRAHLNCVENLPIYGAIVLVIVVSRAQSPALDILALTLIAARIVQTSIHISSEQTNLLATLRFCFFFVQLICMLWMTVLLVQHAL
ncbi:MAG: MAPEG family protein [Polyangiales bacterium]